MDMEGRKKRSCCVPQSAWRCGYRSADFFLKRQNFFFGPSVTSRASAQSFFFFLSAVISVEGLTFSPRWTLCVRHHIFSSESFFIAFPDAIRLICKCFIFRGRGARSLLLERRNANCFEEQTSVSGLSKNQFNVIYIYIYLYKKAGMDVFCNISVHNENTTNIRLHVEQESHLIHSSHPGERQHSNGLFFLILLISCVAHSTKSTSVWKGQL